MSYGDGKIPSVKLLNLVVKGESRKTMKKERGEEETRNSAANKEEVLVLKKGQEKREKKDKKKREGGRVEKTIRTTLSKARKTQKQGRELHQHNTPSSSSSPEKASAEGEKTKRDQNRRGHRFLCP